jgi:UDP-N-acetylmuramyl pentapeptide synthase
LTGLRGTAAKRIAIVSAFQPLWKKNSSAYWATLEYLKHYDTVYTVGSQSLHSLLDTKATTAFLLEEDGYSDAAKTLAAEITRGATVVVKGAGRYQLNSLVNMIKKELNKGNI